MIVIPILGILIALLGLIQSAYLHQVVDLYMIIVFAIGEILGLFLTHPFFFRKTILYDKEWVLFKRHLAQFIWDGLKVWFMIAILLDIFLKTGFLLVGGSMIFGFAFCIGLRRY